MNFKLCTFQELSNYELYTLIQLRSEIFVVEQNCVYQDLDGEDQNALHLLGFENNMLVAYARLIKPGVFYPESAIGRVVVKLTHRAKKYGQDLMMKAVQECLNKFNSQEIIVSAQEHLKKFYSDLGFVTEGGGYLEDNIPHIKMRYKK